MTKGFVTIATGNDRYYEMAYNLCLSYKFFNNCEIPFAIICDRENDYTKIFDKVILISKPFCSFMDKLSLPSIDVYDETIFIDADVLVYGDISYLFEVFNQTDNFVFSAFGTAHNLDYKKGWFTKEGAGEFKDKISFCTGLHGGMYFFKKSNDLLKFSELCFYILEHFDSFKFIHNKPCDESIFALAMAVCNYTPINGTLKSPIIYPGTNKKAKKQKLTVVPAVPSYVIHFGNIHTNSPRYKNDVRKIKCFYSNVKYKSKAFRTLGIWFSYKFKLFKFYLKKMFNR